MKNGIFVLLFSICYLTSFSQIGTFTDPRDGKVYKTMKIGNQTWFAENLAYKPQKGNYCAFENKQSNVATYGYLYDWSTAKKVCPVGWHLPSEKEYETLLLNVSGNNDINNPNIYKSLQPSGNSGFSALYGGFRNYNKTFQAFNIIAFFWTSTSGGGDGAWGFLTGNDGTSSLSNGLKKQCMSSVRCIKNGTKKQKENTNTSSDNGSSSYGSGSDVHTGKRGGKYYYNGHGNKSYIPKSSGSKRRR